jgi:hypothetical protein
MIVLIQRFIRYPDGHGYIGQWRDGWRHGTGVLYFGDDEHDRVGGRKGCRWEGNFEQDKAHGIGTMYNTTSAASPTAVGVVAEYIEGKLIE